MTRNVANGQILTALNNLTTNNQNGQTRETKKTKSVQNSTPLKLHKNKIKLHNEKIR